MVEATVRASEETDDAEVAPGWADADLVPTVTVRGNVAYGLDAAGPVPDVSEDAATLAAAEELARGRLGRDGRPVESSMYKFRSMVPGAEGMLGELKGLNEKSGPIFKMRKGPRVTKVGRLLCKTSLDELPQFANVLKGDIPLHILKTRSEFSVKCMGAFVLPAKSGTNGGKVFSQVASCFASGLRTRRVSECNSNRIGGMEAQFLVKPVFGALRDASSVKRAGYLFEQSNSDLAVVAS